MLPDKKLISQFNRFAGKEVHPAAADPVLDEFRQAAQAAGLSLRVWFPGSVGTMDYKTDRLNVHVSKGADGKYRIEPKFTIG